MKLGKIFIHKTIIIMVGSVLHTFIFKTIRQKMTKKLLRIIYQFNSENKIFFKFNHLTLAYNCFIQYYKTKSILALDLGCYC